MFTIVEDIPDFILSGKLSHFVLFTDEEKLFFSFKHGSNIILSDFYYPDNSGLIFISSLQSLFERYFSEESIIEDFTYSVHGLSEQVDKTFHVLYCIYDTNLSSDAFISSFFLTRLQGKKRTLLENPEFLGMVITENISVTITGNMMLNGKKISFGPYEYMSFSCPVSEYIPVYFNISPSSVQDSLNGTLINYTVMAGKRKMTYYLIRPEYPVLNSFLFKNGFGLFETITISGITTDKGKKHSTIALIGNIFHSFNESFDREYEIVTSYLSDAEIPFFRDFLNSDQVLLLSSDNLSDKPVLITEYTDECSDVLDGMTSFKFTWKYAQQNGRYINVTIPDGIFGDMFDDTFN